MATTGRSTITPDLRKGSMDLNLARNEAVRGTLRVMTELDEVTEVDITSQPKILRTTSGEFEAKTVIIATGAVPRELGIPASAN